MVYPKTPIHELQRRLDLSKTTKILLGKKLDKIDKKYYDTMDEYLESERMVRSLAARLREAKKGTVK